MTDSNNIYSFPTKDPNKTSEMYNPNSSMTPTDFTTTKEPSTFSTSEWNSIIKTCVKAEMNDIMKSNNEESVIKMDAYLEKYIDKIEKDQTDFRQEMRERDARTEERQRERDIRAEERQRELESRLVKFTEESEKRNKDSAKRIEDSIVKIESKLDELETKIDNNNKHIQAITYANIGIALATIIGIASLVYSLFSAFSKVN